MSSVSVGEGSKCTDKLKSLTRLEGEKPSFFIVMNKQGYIKRLIREKIASD